MPLLSLKLIFFYLNHFKLSLLIILGFGTGIINLPPAFKKFLLLLIISL